MNKTNDCQQLSLDSKVLTSLVSLNELAILAFRNFAIALLVWQYSNTIILFIKEMHALALLCKRSHNKHILFIDVAANQDTEGMHIFSTNA